MMHNTQPEMCFLHKIDFVIVSGQGVNTKICMAGFVRFYKS